MLTDIIKNIVKELKVDNIVPAFYFGTNDKINKKLIDENNNFIFFERPYKFTSNKKSAGIFDTDNNINLAFFKHNQITASLQNIDIIKAKLFTLFTDFIREAKKQGYKITNINGTDIINFKMFDNNVSGWFINLTLTIKNNFNDCF